MNEAIELTPTKKTEEYQPTKEKKNDEIKINLHELKKVILYNANRIVSPDKVLNNKQLSGLWWFITEIVQIIFISMGGVMLLWLYAPYTVFWKVVITIISTIIIYDIFKSFVYTKWIIWKENLNE